MVAVTAARFAEVCGRTVVKKGDILIALKFQAHESDLDAPTPALPEDPGEEADSDSDESVESSQPAEKEEEQFITSGKWRGKHNSLSRGAGTCDSFLFYRAHTQSLAQSTTQALSMCSIE